MPVDRGEPQRDRHARCRARTDRISLQDCDGGVAVCTRRPQRHVRASGREGTAAGIRAARDRREQAWRQYAASDGTGRAFGAGRAPAGDLHRHQHGVSAHDRAQAAVQPGERLRPDHPALRRADPADRSPGPPVELGGRPHCRWQGAARQAHLCIGRRRVGRSHRRRVVQVAGRREHGAHPLPGSRFWDSRTSSPAMST